MSDNETATATKAAKNRTPLSYTLVEVEQDEAGNVTGFKPAVQPELSKEQPRREDYRREILKRLKKGDQAAIENWNGKRLTVIAYPAPFCFNATVKIEEVRNVVIDES